MKGRPKTNQLIKILLLILVLALSANSSYAVEATLAWDAPTTNADGTPLTDLAGYKVYYGAQSDTYDQNIDVGNVTTYLFTSLTAGSTYYFAVTAYDTSGNESEYSVEVNKNIPITDTTSFTYYCDNDNDSYFNPSIDGSCTGTGCVPAGCQTTAGNDCNDNNAQVNPGASDSDCNGIDENCDGTADNNYVATGTTCGEGVCSSTGQLTCSNGVVVNTCTAGNPTGDDSDCNGIDENCDGTADNNFVVTATACGEGICAATGQLSCENGSLTDTCSIIAPECLPETSTVISIGDTWKYFKGISSQDSGWKDIAFDDSAWLEGPTGIGYGDGDDATVLSDMQNNYISVYARKTFNISNRLSITAISLHIDYDDGFVAYLNGNEVARGNMPDGTPDNNTFSTGREAGTVATFDLSSYKNYLVSGNNVLAIEVHNKTLSSSDLTLIPELIIEETPDNTTPVDYYCDNDSDGYVNSSIDGSCTGTGCEPAGCQTTAGNDCNDNSVQVNPGAGDSDCNGIDENCDGIADNNYVAADTTCGEGVCASTGQLTCSNGAVVNTCTEGSPTGDDSDCNGIDENCDGSADNNYVASTVSCGTGECSSTGQILCQDGTEVNSCTPDTPAEATELTCDGLDNDCDGLVDESCQPAIKVSKVLLSEDFSSGIPDTWSVSGAWNTENSCGKSIGDPLTEPFAIADSSCMETGVDELVTEPFNTTSCNNVEVSYSNQYFWYSGSIGVDVSNDGGTSWTPNTTTYTDDGYTAANKKDLDISSSITDGEAQVRFTYTNNETSGHWAIDDVIVTCQSTTVDLASEVSVPVQETIIITNTGATSLTTGMINIEGADSAEFSLVDDHCSYQTLLPDETCMFDVAFTPVTEGSKSVAISISSNDPEMPVVALLLSGTGTLPDAVTQPVVQILANGLSDVINLKRGESINISIELDPGSYIGTNADMWVLFEYRNRLYHYTKSNGKWRRGDSTFDQGPLSSISPVDVLNSSHLSKGHYTFYFMVDTNMDGYKDTDQMYLSEVQVNIN